MAMNLLAEANWRTYRRSKRKRRDHETFNRMPRDLVNHVSMRLCGPCAQVFSGADGEI